VTARQDGDWICETSTLSVGLEYVQQFAHVPSHPNDEKNFQRWVVFALPWYFFHLHLNHNCKAVVVFGA
jgi:hypothetical protein